MPTSMSDSIICQSKYNIKSFNELTYEDYNDTLELSLCHRGRTAFRRDQYYIKSRTVKSNIEKVVELNDFYADNPLSEFLTNFENTCFYWYITSMRDSNTSCETELPFIYEGDFHSCGAFISNHTFNHKDNSFSFQIEYSYKGYEYFAKKLLPITNNKLTINEFMDCFWQVSNNAVTFNKRTRDVNNCINGSVEICKVSDTKSFFNIVIPALQSYLYRLSKIHFIS